MTSVGGTVTIGGNLNGSSGALSVGGITRISNGGNLILGGSTAIESNNIGGGTSTYQSTEGGQGTSDPPPATGGSGITSDPPPGDTEDPPPGDTEDPPPGDTDDPPPGDTIDPPPGDTIDPPPGDTADPPDTCTFTEIDKVNVIVFGNANPSGADSEGKMWVGGDASLSGYSVGSNDLGGSTTACSETNLVVGGNLSGQVNANKGKVAVYGSTSGASVSWSTTPACGYDKSKPVDFAALQAKFEGYSAALAQYDEIDPSTVGTVKITNGALVLVGSNTTLNVFNVTGDQLKSINSFDLQVPKQSSVIINVSGTTILMGNMGYKFPDGAGLCKADKNSTWCHRIVYNFYEATKITISGTGVQGSVIAPYATVDGGGGNIDGQLVCKNLTGGLEYHPYFFSGCLLLPSALKK